MFSLCTSSRAKRHPAVRLGNDATLLHGLEIRKSLSAVVVFACYGLVIVRRLEFVSEAKGLGDGALDPEIAL